MKLAKIIVLLLLLSLIPINGAFSLRINDNLIEVGDTKTEVFLIAGNPMNRQIIGVMRSSTSEIYIEVWTYRVEWYGNVEYYDLVFWGNYLKKIIWIDYDGS